MARFGFDGNPLRRRTDRVESAVLLAALLLSVALLPVGVVIGVSVGHALHATAERQSEVRLEVEGTVLEQPTVSDTTGAVWGSLPLVARVAWTTPDGVDRSATMVVPSNARRGSSVPVWTTTDGTLARAPLTAAQATGDAVATAVVAQLTMTAAVWLGFLAIRCELNRRRYRAWDAGWLRFGGGS